MSEEDLKRIECAIAPGEGACGGMYTANTMASVAEALGLSLPVRPHRPPRTVGATTSPTARARPS